MKFILLVHSESEYYNNKYLRYEFDSLEDLEIYRNSSYKNTAYEIVLPKSELDSASFYKEKFEEIYKLMFDKMFNDKESLNKLKEIL